MTATRRLATSATLDREFVMEVLQANVPKDALVAQDGNESVVVAVARALEDLGPENRPGLLRFGSGLQWMTQGVEPCTRTRVAAPEAAVPQRREHDLSPQ